nr:copia protein [Tanacetum cinerariifolium]
MKVTLLDTLCLAKHLWYLIKRTKRVEENLHVELLENKAIEKGADPNWLFDIDSLTKSMNYVPVVAGIHSTNFSGTKDAATQEVKKDVSSLRYIALPNWVHDALLESSSSKPQDNCSTDVLESSGNSNPTATSTNPSADHMETLTVETPILTVSLPVPTACFTNSQEPSNILGVTTNSDESNGVEADKLCRKSFFNSKSRMFGLWVLKNKKDERGIVIRNKGRLVAQGHTQEEGIDYDEVFAPVTRIEAIRLFLAYASFMEFTVYQMDVKSAFLYGTIDEEVYVMQPPGFQDLEFRARVYKVEKAIRLISWQCKKQKIVATLTTEAKYVAAASCRGQVLWIQNQLLDYGDCFEKKLINVDHIHTDENVTDLLTKPFDARRFQYLVSEHNVDFHPIVDFVDASPLGYALTFKPTVYVSHIRQFWSTDRIETTEKGTKILATVDDILRTVTESSLRRNLKRARIAYSSALPPVADEPASPLRDVNQGEACPIVSSLDAEQDRANITKTSTLPHESTSRVPSLAADEGTQELEFNRLKARVKLLEDREGGVAERSEDDAPIKGRNLDKGEAAAERVRVQVVPTAAEVATATVSIPAGSDVVPIASLIFATASIVTLYTRRKGKEKMVETNTPKKKKKFQEQIDIQMARQLEEEMC